MAVTAIDHGGRVVPVVSRRIVIPSSNETLQSFAFTTHVYGESAKTVWQATSWSASLRNHATAVSQVVN
ncbi:hypothetical protein, partial [Bradyrhizobium sp.]|uniref:hypothetical protein n=1 Tax=Bradyrhizobium sp. TaxID=376 RepID=UPI003C331C51